MEKIIIILLYLSWIIYSSTTGIIEGYLYHFRDSNNVNYRHGKGLHIIFTTSRIFAAIGLVMCIRLISSTLNTFGFILSIITIFPFIHDGMYYKTRKYIDGKFDKGWADYSNYSDAYIHLRYKERLILAIISVLTLIFILL